jgi:hypothetical protein
MNRLLVLVCGVALLGLGCRDTNRDGYGEHEGQYGSGETAERPEVPTDPEEAREDLPEQTDETLTAQREAAEARAQLDALIARACSGVQDTMQTECPVAAGEVRSVREIDNGVAVSLDEPADQADDLERRMDCYLAHTVLRQSGQVMGPNTRMPGQQPGGVAPNAPQNPGTTAPQPGVAPGQYACIVDSPDVDVDVEEENGRIELEITSDDDAKVELLRARARDLASHASR